MIADHYLQLRTELETALGSLLRLASELRRESATLDTVQGLLTDAREPLLFVVVGEVKAGKSSLLNALFGQEFARADVLPATDRVYVFKYAEKSKTVEISPRLTERYEPIEFLRDFNIVDTPGTNTMVAEHQTITEDFVPRADLVLFVFSVTNPWTQSAWELLRFVQKKWLKHIVFVLQQADLRDPAEITIVQRHLQETAMQRIGFTPPIFAVSAKKALLAKTSGLDKERLWEESGFAPLEAQINSVVDSEGARMMKLQSIVGSARVILGEMATEVRGSFELIERDQANLGRIESVLEGRKQQTLRQVAGFLRGVEQASRSYANQAMELLEERLSFWRTWRLVFTRGDWQAEFQHDVETRLKDSIQPQVENAVQLLETDLRGLWPQLQEMIESQFASDARSKVPRTIPDFARQRRELLQAVQLSLVERAAGDRANEQLAEMLTETATWLRVPAGVAAAGGLVAVVTWMTSAAVADVTGILAGSALVFGSAVAFGRRKKILTAYGKQLDERRAHLLETIEEKLNHSIDLFYKEIRTAFEPLEAFYFAQRKALEPILQRTTELEEKVGDLHLRLARGETK